MSELGFSIDSSACFNVEDAIVSFFSGFALVVVKFSVFSNEFKYRIKTVIVTSSVHPVIVVIFLLIFGRKAEIKTVFNHSSGRAEYTT